MSHNISPKAWIIVGIIVWGIPTGIMLAMMIALMKPDAFLEINQFQIDVFVRATLFAVPIFSFLGVLLGLVMYQLVKGKLSQH